MLQPALLAAAQPACSVPAGSVLPGSAASSFPRRAGACCLRHSGHATPRPSGHRPHPASVLNRGSSPGTRTRGGRRASSPLVLDLPDRGRLAGPRGPTLPGMEVRAAGASGGLLLHEVVVGGRLVDVRVERRPDHRDRPGPQRRRRGGRGRRAGRRPGPGPARPPHPPRRPGRRRRAAVVGRRRARRGGLGAALRRPTGRWPPAWLRASATTSGRRHLDRGASTGGGRQAGAGAAPQRRVWVLNAGGLAALGVDAAGHPGVERDDAGGPPGGLLGLDRWLRERLPAPPPPDLAPVGRRSRQLRRDRRHRRHAGRRPSTTWPPLAAPPPARCRRGVVTRGPARRRGPAGPVAVGPVKLVLADHALPALDDAGRRDARGPRRRPGRRRSTA